MLYHCVSAKAIVRYLSALGVLLACACGEARAEGPKAGGFWEPGFPFLEATVDARKVSSLALTNNLTIRGIVLPLGNNTFACFDTDLLRLSYVWQGDGLQFASMAPISYVKPDKKNDVGQVNLNRPVGEAISAVGFYPGVAGKDLRFSDPRTPGLDPGELGRGPIAASLGRWEGIFTVGDKAVLHYTVEGTDVHEFFGAQTNPDTPRYARNFEDCRAFRELFISCWRDYSVLRGHVSPGTAAGP